MQCFGGLICWAYDKPRPEFTRFMNIKDCTKMTIDQKYVGKICKVRYGLKVSNITERQKGNLGKAK